MPIKLLVTKFSIENSRLINNKIKMEHGNIKKIPKNVKHIQCFRSII